MDKVLNTVIDITSNVLTVLFGGWSEALTTFIIFMAIDYLFGLIVAGIFKNSAKSDSSAFELCMGIKCLFRKVGMLALIIIAYRVDILSDAGGHLTRDMVTIALCINESISIIKKLGLMGLKIPTPLCSAIDLLKNSSKSKSEKESKN